LDDEGEIESISKESRKDHPILEKNSPYQKVAAHVQKLRRQGVFDKPWILIPLNIGNLHWVFVALLNASYLGRNQDNKMSGFLYYDSLNPNTSREEALREMHDNGILNLVIYANLAFGHPNLNGDEVKERIISEERFPKFEIPMQDFVEQKDGSNCGIFVWLCMLEMSMLHCKKYQKKEDFQSMPTDKDGVNKFFLQDGDWFKTFRDPKLGTAAKTGSTSPAKRPQVTSLSSDFFWTVREQANVLFNRILTLKTKKHFDPRMPKQPVPYHYTVPNIVKHIWNYDDTQQEDIKV